MRPGPGERGAGTDRPSQAPPHPSTGGLPRPDLLGATGGHEGPHVRGHAQARGRHVAQADAVLGEQAGQRMHRAAMLQVAHHRDLGRERKGVGGSPSPGGPPD